jgi:hypothetical protein
MHFLPEMASFAPHEAILLEMKSSASLRFFKPGINSKVAEYDQSLQFLKSYQQNALGLYTEVRNTKALLFNFNTMMPQTRSRSATILNTTGLLLILLFIQTHPCCQPARSSLTNLSRWPVPGFLKTRQLMPIH